MVIMIMKDTGTLVVAMLAVIFAAVVFTLVAVL